MINKKQMPDIMPDFTVTKSDKEPFEVRWEETMGWFIIPKLGFECNWAMYDYPDKNRTETVEMKVVGKANVHGIEGVEIVSYEHNPKEFNATDENKTVERRFVAQLTDTHVRMLAESHYIGDMKYYYTFLDGEEFIPNWGFGEDNCGKEVLVKSKGMIKCDGKDKAKDGKSFTVPNVPFTFFDVAGRYIVDINGRSYDTIRVMDIEYYNDGVMAEHYIDENGRTVLWRRYNRDNWAISRYKQKWSEKFPDNERIIINGELYIHWYDCITDYIL